MAALTLTVACDGDGDPDAGTDAGTPDDDAGTPPGDAGTDAGPPDAGPSCDGPPGLYIDGSCTIIAPGVRLFQPAYSLWADTATKERYILLPSGTQIDTSDPDNWVFPVGTTVFKTFLRDGVRMETRVLRKRDFGTGIGAWDMRAYAWNADQDEVTDVTNLGLEVRQNVLGTTHDIPSGADCVECHRGAVDVLNGFSAIQLNHGLGDFDLADLLAEGLLTDPPAPTDADVPGDGAIETGLGYLHANCGHCHRYTQYDTPPPPGCSDALGRCGTCSGSACSTGLRMWLRVQDILPADTDTFVTALGRRSNMVNGDAICRIHPGNSTRSMIHVRMTTRRDDGIEPALDFLQMPPLASEVVHANGAAEVAAFIAATTGDASACVP